MVCFILKLILIAGLQLASGYAKVLPKFIPTCHQNDPMLSDCVKNATVYVKPYLIKGIPELGIAGIEPLMIPMVKLEQDSKMVNYKAMLKNITVEGLSTYNVTNLYVQTDMFAINGKVKFDFLKVNSHYFITGRILKTPIHGEGNYFAVFNETKCNFMLRGQVVQKKGVQYYSNSDTTVDCDANKGEVIFEKLFDGDQKLSKKTNDFIKENSDALAKEVKPAVNSIITMYVNDMIHSITSTTPFNDLFPRMV